MADALRGNKAVETASAMSRPTSEQLRRRTGQLLNNDDDDIARDLAKITATIRGRKQDVDKAEKALRDLGRTRTDAAKEVAARQ